MAKFVYALQNILTIKYKLEDQAKIQYGIQKVAYEQQVDKLEELKLRKVQYERLQKQHLQNRLVFYEIERTSRAIETMKERISEQVVRVAAARRKLEQATQAMNQAMMERKAHEKLKENAFESFKKELLQIESKEVDELVSYKYNKSNEDV